MTRHTRWFTACQHVAWQDSQVRTAGSSQYQITHLQTSEELPHGTHTTFWPRAPSSCRPCERAPSLVCKECVCQVQEQLRKVQAPKICPLSTYLRHWHSSSHSPLVCEGCMCQVQQVLNQQTMLHWHFQLDLRMDVIPSRRLRGVGHLRSDMANATGQSASKHRGCVRRCHMHSSWLKSTSCHRVLLQGPIGLRMVQNLLSTTFLAARVYTVTPCLLMWCAMQQGSHCTGWCHADRISTPTSGGTPSPGQTQMNPSFSTHGSAATDTLRQWTVEGILVQEPSPSNCQPW
jgi:hypothetical protein